MDNYKTYSAYMAMLEMAVQELKEGAHVCEDMTAEQLDEVYFLLYCVESYARDIRDTLNEIECNR